MYECGLWQTKISSEISHDSIYKYLIFIIFLWRSKEKHVILEKCIS